MNATLTTRNLRNFNGLWPRRRCWTDRMVGSSFAAQLGCLHILDGHGLQAVCRRFWLESGYWYMDRLEHRNGEVSP